MTKRMEAREVQKCSLFSQTQRKSESISRRSGDGRGKNEGVVAKDEDKKGAL